MQARPIAEAADGRRIAVILCAILVVVWALELLIVQEVTTRPDDTLSLGHVLKYAARRMVLNVAACTLLVCVLNRAWLYGVFLVGGVFSAVTITYAEYFERPLSWLTVSNQWREGMSVTEQGVGLVSWVALVLLCGVLALKLVLREVIRRRPLPADLRRRTAAIAGVGYLVAAVGLAGVHKPISRVNIGSPEYVYGYAVAWVAECLTYDADAILADAVATSAVKSRALSDRERLLEFQNHIVVIQVESLDFDAVDATAGEQYVMSFLHALKSQSKFYMVKPFHVTGSSDADFSLLTASTPNGRITPFKVLGFPYGESLPWLVERLGYDAVAIHGNTGTFFQRRNAYEQMGFSKLYFATELEKLGVNGANDDELLRFSAKLIDESARPMFHFIITWTSHGPFDQLPPDAERLFASPEGIHQHYLNSMRYVDRSLARYYQALPDNTTLVIYGDHHSNVQGYVAGDAHPHRVPWLICRKGTNLAERQETLGTGLATSGDLGQLDMACYLRDSVEAATLSAKRTDPTQPHIR